MKSAEYPISANYCAKWSIVEGIREIIANALDTKQPYTISWESGYGTIEDTGNGFPKECLILGEGESKDETQIGQFREGLKIAGLVFARNDRYFSGETVGYMFNFRMDQSSTFNCKTLFMDFEDNSRGSGTIITFECSESELDIAKSLFIDDNRDTEFIVPDRPGELFINKVFVNSIDKAMYGYNIVDKGAANRDRSVLSMGNVKGSIGRIWALIDDSELIRSYLLTEEQYVEHDVVFRIKEKNKSLWIDELKSIYGNKYCLFDTTENAHRVKDLGYAIINPISWDQGYTLNNYVDVPYCKDILEDRIKQEYIDFTSQLSPNQLRTYNIAMDMAMLYYEEPINIMVVEKLSFLEDSDVLAHTDYEAKIIRITPDLIDKGLKKLVGGIVHEQTHLIKRHTDASRAFENDLTDIVGDLMVKLNKSMLLGRDNI